MSLTESSSVESSVKHGYAQKWIMAVANISRVTLRSANVKRREQPSLCKPFSLHFLYFTSLRAAVDIQLDRSLHGVRNILHQPHQKKYPLINGVNNSNHLVTMQQSAGKHWVLALKAINAGYPMQDNDIPFRNGLRDMTTSRWAGF